MPPFSANGLHQWTERVLASLTPKEREFLEQFRSSDAYKAGQVKASEKIRGLREEAVARWSAATQMGEKEATRIKKLLAMQAKEEEMPSGKVKARRQKTALDDAAQLGVRQVFEEAAAKVPISERIQLIADIVEACEKSDKKIVERVHTMLNQAAPTLLQALSHISIVQCPEETKPPKRGRSK